MTALKYLTPKPTCKCPVPYPMANKRGGMGGVGINGGGGKFASLLTDTGGMG